MSLSSSELLNRHFIYISWIGGLDRVLRVCVLAHPHGPAHGPHWPVNTPYSTVIYSTITYPALPCPAWFCSWSSFNIWSSALSYLVPSDIGRHHSAPHSITVSCFQCFLLQKTQWSRVDTHDEWEGRRPHGEEQRIGHHYLQSTQRSPKAPTVRYGISAVKHTHS